MRPVKPDRTVELLAPAGDAEAMRAAIANGANAVYFGLQEFNARRRAANFTLENLPQTIDELHRHNVQAYVAFNTLIFTDELERAARHLEGIAEAGADAVIVQDLGVLRLVREMCPRLPVHASTQMTQTNAAGIRLLSELGISRIILARELSLQEIAAIARAVDVELETFVHGALCISYSGQCLASESLFGRSANRGLCAQPCRLPYQLVVDGKVRRMPDGPYLLSPKDLATYDRIPELIAAGVKGFKIEGRLKSAAYVAAATGLYRAAIDAAARGEPFCISSQQRDALELSFSRGFTPGFLDGNRHQSLVGRAMPKSYGIRVGTVVGITSRGIRVSPTAGRSGSVSLKPGDGIVFGSGQPEDEEQGGRIYTVVPVHAGQSAGHGASRKRRKSPAREMELTFGRGDLDSSRVAIGSSVWKTHDPEVQRRLEQTYSRLDVVHRTPLCVRAQLCPDGCLAVTFREGGGEHVEIRSEAPLQTAEKHPLTVELLREQMGRLGDTPFQLESVELVGPDRSIEKLRVLAPKSLLNELRRRGVEALLAARKARARKPVVHSAALERLRGPRAAAAYEGRAEHPAPQMHVLVRRPEQLESVLTWRTRGTECRIGLIYCDLGASAAIRAAVDSCRAAGIPAAVATPRILKPGEEALLKPLMRLSSDAVLVRSLAALEYLKQPTSGVPLIADFSLNAANEIAFEVLVKAGVRRVTASYDLSAGQLAAMMRGIPAESLEIVIHQHVPMFHTAYCLAAGCLGRADGCAGGRKRGQAPRRTSSAASVQNGSEPVPFCCDRPCDRHEIELRDRIGVNHPVFSDSGGRSTVFNCRPQSAAESWRELSRLTLCQVRIELLRESAEQTQELLSIYADLLAGKISGVEAGSRLRELYPQGITAGTWAFEEGK